MYRLLEDRGRRGNEDRGRPQVPVTGPRPQALLSLEFGKPSVPVVVPSTAHSSENEGSTKVSPISKASSDQENIGGLSDGIGENGENESKRKMKDKKRHKKEHKKLKRQKKLSKERKKHRYQSSSPSSSSGSIDSDSSKSKLRTKCVIID